MNNQHHISALITAVFYCLVTSGCHSSSTISNNTAAGTTAVFIATQSGGCARIGPNCAQHILYNDGNVEVKRQYSDTIESQSTIDSGLVSSWSSLVDSTDFDALKHRLPAGECAGCFDGIDYEYLIYSESNSVKLSSIEYRFEQTEPFFAVTEGLYQAMRNTAPLEIRTRPTQ